MASRAWSPPLRQSLPSSVPAAGSAFCQAAQLHLQLQSKHDAATCFVDAGNAFKKADPQGEGLCKPRAPAEPPAEKASGFRPRHTRPCLHFNSRIGSLPPGVWLLLSGSQPPPPPAALCLKLMAPLPEPGSMWEWELHFRPTACPGERKICSVVRINTRRGREGVLRPAR